MEIGRCIELLSEMKNLRMKQIEQMQGRADVWQPKREFSGGAGNFFAAGKCAKADHTVAISCLLLLLIPNDFSFLHISLVL